MLEERTPEERTSAERELAGELAEREPVERSAPLRAVLREPASRLERPPRDERDDAAPRAEERGAVRDEEPR